MYGNILVGSGDLDIDILWEGIIQFTTSIFSWLELGFCHFHPGES